MATQSARFNTIARSTRLSKKILPIHHHLRCLAFTVACSLFICGNGLAGDVPAAIQKPGDHSEIWTEDGGLRDDEFVDFVCQMIIENGGKVKDIKFMSNACYGGGILDDLQRAFGPGGACEGIPWVGGTASAHDESALGWSDKRVYERPADHPGSLWTDALVGTSLENTLSYYGVIHDGSETNNVLQDFVDAGRNDAGGQQGLKKETPQVASGNNGDQITWNSPGARHVAIVFGGDQTNKRHHNNIDNMTNALMEVWKDATNVINPIDGGSRDDLLDAIETAAKKLDENTQFVFYIDDHGAKSHDALEAADIPLESRPVRIEEPTTYKIDLTPGWFQGFYGNVWMGDDPSPSLDFDITDCVFCSDWSYYWNRRLLSFPEDNPTGRVSIELPFWTIHSWKTNKLEIELPAPSQKQSEQGQSPLSTRVLELSNLELNSGGINDLEADTLQIPAQSAAFYDPGRNGEGIFVELLDNGKAVVYVFTYPVDGEGQAWMLGVGDLVGQGIVSTEMFMPTGPSFGADYDVDDLVMNEFGGLAFAFPSCGTDEFKGVLAIPPSEVEDYDTLLLSLEYTQITEIVDCESGDKSAYSGYSGSWYDPSHNGEGIILQVLTSGVALVQWFTFDESGKQMWIQGTGNIEGDVLTVDNLYTTSGTAYGAGFNQDDVIKTPWGVLTMEFTSCGEATVEYESSAGFGPGTLNMQRITNLMGIPCEDPDRQNRD